MATLARLFLAVVVCPVTGAALGAGLGRWAATLAHLSAPVAMGSEMVGLLVGLALGIVFGVLLAYCVIGCGGRLRGRIADPVIVGLSSLAVIEVVVGLAKVSGPAGAALRGCAGVAWTLGFLFVWLGVKLRPREP